MPDTTTQPQQSRTGLKVLSQVSWIISIGCARTVWHMVGGGTLGVVAVVSLILGGIIAAGTIWPTER